MITTSLVVVLWLSAVCIFSLSNALVEVRGDALAWQVDVYTQKQPFSGVGLGQPSDAFGPDELVILYANVTYNGGEVQNVLVGFSVCGPPNPVYNITLFFSAVSDSAGTAQVEFRISSPVADVENVTFGTWDVVSNTENASDYLTFRVGWIVEIRSVDLSSGVDPPQGGRLGVQVGLSNIAMLSQSVSLFVAMYDSSNSILFIVDQDITVDVGRTSFSAVLAIPLYAALGNGIVEVLLSTPNGTPYAPPRRSGTFTISLFGDLNGDGIVDLADIAVAAQAFGSYLGHPRWNPLADVNKDNVVDLNDIALIAQRFGTHE